MKASVRQHDPHGGMNRLESAWASELQILKLAGEVADFQFEGVKLKLATRTFYTPDFFVVMTNGNVEIHEVKGHWEDDARVKIKMAAKLFPWFTFKAIRKPGGKQNRGKHSRSVTWDIEVIPT